MVQCAVVAAYYIHICIHADDALGSIHQPCSHVHIYVIYKNGFRHSPSVGCWCMEYIRTCIQLNLPPPVGNQWDIKDTSCCWAKDACLNIFLPPSQQLHMARPLNWCFAIESEFFYGNQNGALFPILAMYNEIIPPGFPGEMIHINHLIVTLSSLWFESHLATYFSCLAGAEWILINFDVLKTSPKISSNVRQEPEGLQCYQWSISMDRFSRKTGSTDFVIRTWPA